MNYHQLAYASINQYSQYSYQPLIISMPNLEIESQPNLGYDHKISIDIQDYLEGSTLARQQAISQQVIQNLPQLALSCCYLGHPDAYQDLCLKGKLAHQTG